MKCSQCSNLAEPNKRRCLSCLEKSATCSKSRRKSLKATGMCIQCGNQPANTGGSRCGHCVDTNNAATRRGYMEQVLDGMCTKCDNPAEIGHTRCKQHLNETITFNHARKAKWKEARLCCTCGGPKIDQNLAMCQKCRDASAARHHELKLKAFDAYGGCKCACPKCLENNVKLLTLDHINNDGNVHRKAINARSVYRWLKTNNYPPGYQVLCFNCNTGRSLNGGICPHME
jgi:hypothetical protein